jgi:hypothetical protein
MATPSEFSTSFAEDRYAGVRPVSVPTRAVSLSDFNEAVLKRALVAARVDAASQSHEVLLEPNSTYPRAWENQRRAAYNNANAQS